VWFVVKLYFYAFIPRKLRSYKYGQGVVSGVVSCLRRHDARIRVQSTAKGAIDGEKSPLMSPLPSITALVSALRAEEVRAFIENKYKGAVIPAF
jgi:hypothetical protein